MSGEELGPRSAHEAIVAAMTEADIRATIEGDVLTVVSKYGGEIVQAGPAMSAMVDELADVVNRWRTGERP